MQVKYCSSCRSSKPASTAYFHRHAGRRDGWHDECRDCRSRLRKSGTERRQRADERTTIRRLAKLIREGHKVPEPERLIRFAYRYFGGSEGVARAMREVYDDPASTPLAQAGILTAIVRLIPAAEERERQAREESERRNRSRIGRVVGVGSLRGWT